MSLSGTTVMPPLAPASNLLGQDLCVAEVCAARLRIAHSASGNEAASLLAQKMYAWRGYSIEHKSQSEPNKITFVADVAGATVGTMTLCFDGDMGLPADEIFNDKLDELRNNGRRLCEPSRLAIDQNVFSSSRVFAALIHLSYIYAYRIHDFTDYVIEVNPRHVNFYKRILGFQTYGERRLCVRVGAPAVLLRLELNHMEEQIRKYGGMLTQQGGGKSFYPCFFPWWDEPMITDRLVCART